ncbi:YgaP family membrane protein [Acidithiobacillus sp.]
MQCNVGGVDRVGRIVIGVVLLLVWFLVPLGLVWQVVVLVIAAIALVTGIVRFCPLNTAFGINTCGGKKGSGADGAG